MKKSTFLAAIFGIGILNVSAQTTTESTNGNVLYAGIDNHIQVISNEIGCGLEKVTCSDETGVTISGDSCNYILKTLKAGTTVNIYVWAVNANPNEKVALSKKQYKIEAVPTPLFYLGTQAATNGVIEIKKSQLAGGLPCIRLDPTFPIDIKYSIVSFNVTGKKDGKAVNYQCESSYSDDAKTFVNSLNPKGSFTLTNIKVKGPDGTVKDLGTIVVKVL
ncbi:MAG: hypothetical protein IAE98_03750 [Candidatus Kapabacteria bacterium]|nr:hypothetical protein [Candidatus Kapabacteria bacterium]